MKNVRGFFYGLAIAIAMSATAATVYNYFPPPGMTYTPTTGLVIGTATGGAQGTGTVNAQGVFINGTAALTSAGVPAGANPTGAVGLTAVNGVATTFLRSDAAPSLSQSITPTWTGLHTFSANVVFNNSSAATDTKNTLFRESTVSFSIQSATDAAPSTPVTALLSASRTGTAWTAVSIGNATDNPTYSFLGTGQFSIGGGEVVGSPTGGNQGTGTINMQGCFVNGVACSTGGAAAANPTGTVGLSTVNGVAGTFLRSDGAPPLSQAISPTWTGTHTFSSLVGNGATAFQGANTGSGYNIKFRDTTNSVDRGFIGIGTTTVAGAAVTDFAISPGVSGSVVIGTANGGAIGTRFGSNGNVTITPSSGIGATVTGGIQADYLGVGRTPSSGVTRIAVDNGGSGDDEVVVQTTTAGNAQFRTVNLGGTNWSVGNLRSDNSFNICNASTLTGCAVKISTAGNNTFNAPSSGATATFNGIASSAQSIVNLIGGANGSATLLLQDGQTGTRQWLVESGNPAVGNFRIRDATAGADRFVINTAGNASIPAPSSGVGLSMTGVANSNVASFTGSTTSGQSLGIRITAGTTSADNAINIVNSAQTANSFVVRGDGSFVLGLNGLTTILTGSAAGDVSIAAPSSGPAFSVQGGNGNTAVFASQSTSGSAFGVVIQAGTTSADYALNITSQNTATQFFKIFGDGGVTAGSPTGGDKGAGTINATALYVNGAAVGVGGVKFAAGTLTTSGGGCTINQNTSSSLGGCTRTGTGVVQVTATGYSSGSCVTASASTAYIAIAVGAMSGNTQVVNINTPGGSAIDGQFSIACIGN